MIAAKQKVWKREYDVICIAVINFLILLAHFSVWGGRSLTEDGFVILQKGLDYNARWNVTNYRWMGALVIKFLSLTGHNPIHDASVDILLFVCAASVLTATITINIYREVSEQYNKILQLTAIDCSVLITIINVAVCDLISYPECIAVFSTGLLLLCGAVWLSNRDDRIMTGIGSICLLVLSTACFQQLISFYIIYEFEIKLVRLMKRGGFTGGLKKALQYYVRPVLILISTGLIYLIISLLALRLTGVSGSERAASSAGQIAKNIVHYILHQYTYIRWHESFSTEIMLICGITAFVLFFFSVFQSAEKKERFWIIIIVTIICYASMFIPGILSNSTQQRTLMCVFSIYFVLCVSILTIHSFGNKLLILFCALLLFVLSINMYRSAALEVNGKIANSNDKAYADSIISVIDNYEKESGVTIQRVAFCEDEHREYNQAKSYFGCALDVSWSKNVFFDCLSNRHFEIIEVPGQIYDEYFANHDWHTINLFEQVVITQDTAYVCIY